MAPVLLVLLRMAQGFGVGGEWGGAVLMAVEHAPAGKRGFYGSWPQIGVPAGLFLATLVYFPFTRMPEADFLSWGWRVTLRHFAPSRGRRGRRWTAMRDDRRTPQRGRHGSG